MEPTTEIDCVLVWDRGGRLAAKPVDGRHDDRRLPEIRLSLPQPPVPFLYLEQIHSRLAGELPGGRFLTYAGEHDGRHVVCLTDEMDGPEQTPGRKELQGSVPDSDASARASVSWTERSKLEDEDRSVVEIAEKHASETEIPWHRRDWIRAELVPWLEKSTGEPCSVHDLTPLRSSDRSYVARWTPGVHAATATSGGPASAGAEPTSLYIKCDREPLPSDAAVTELLASPEGPVPQPVAVDAARGWMLMKPLPGRPLSASDPTSFWEAAAGTLARLQRSTEAECEPLFALGTRDYRGARLGERLLAMLSDPKVVGNEEDGGISADDASVLPDLQEWVRDWCAWLKDSKIPATVVHQDFVTCNIHVTPGTEADLATDVTPGTEVDPAADVTPTTDPDPIADADPSTTGSTTGSGAGPGSTPAVWVFDWSDTVLGHPFFSFDRLLDECWSDEERKSAAIQAYLEAWSDVADSDALLAEFKRCQRLRVLYEALRWYDEIRYLPPTAPNHRLLQADLRTGVVTMLRWIRTNPQ